MCTQQTAVYEHSARDAVCSVLNGFNACLFVYGQTGSGKTHTIFGPDSLLHGPDSLTDATVPKSAGVVLRALAELVDTPARASVSLSVRASYVEIYNEEVTDLLNGMPLQVRDGRCVGASTRELHSLADGIGMLKEGEVRKSRAATAMNDRSSRAHTMVIVTVKQVRDGQQMVSSELALVDLAGCEQLKQSRAEGQQKLEATAINRSLMVLRQCISALVEGKSHVPFYESKLTMLLRPAFSGNSRTTAVICGAPEPSNAEQTLSALRFGEDCGSIATKALCAGVRSVSEAVATITSALERCESDLAALAERGKQNLPAYRKLTEKFQQLSAKKLELIQVAEGVGNSKRSQEARQRRKAALSTVQAQTAQSNAEAEAQLNEWERDSGQGGGGLFIPF